MSLCLSAGMPTVSAMRSLNRPTVASSSTPSNSWLRESRVFTVSFMAAAAEVLSLDDLNLNQNAARKFCNSVPSLDLFLQSAVVAWMRFRVAAIVTRHHRKEGRGGKGKRL